MLAMMKRTPCTPLRAYFLFPALPHASESRLKMLLQCYFTLLFLYSLLSMLWHQVFVHIKLRIILVLPSFKDVMINCIC